MLNVGSSLWRKHRNNIKKVWCIRTLQWGMIKYWRKINKFYRVECWTKPAGQQCILKDRKSRSLHKLMNPGDWSHQNHSFFIEKYDIYNFYHFMANKKPQATIYRRYQILIQAFSWLLKDFDCQLHFLMINPYNYLCLNGRICCQSNKYPSKGWWILRSQGHCRKSRWALWVKVE